MRSPKERLCGFVLIVLRNREIVAQFGCPMGTFCSELNKEGGVLAQKASGYYTDLLAWIETQFRDFCAKGEARGHALHLLSALQGAGKNFNTGSSSLSFPSSIAIPTAVALKLLLTPPVKQKGHNPANNQRASCWLTAASF
jgi:hypothetical protein